jgi:uncharacterized integral membrane protein
MMIKSRAKWAFYILILSALAYVFLMLFSLDNTRAIEGLTPDLPRWINKMENTATSIDGNASPDEVAFQNSIESRRKALAKRLKDLKTNKPNRDIYSSTTYTSIVWATLATVLLFVVFTGMEN